MGSRLATELLHLPVRLHGIRLGRPVDVLLAPTLDRALGFVVHCGDENDRFLALPAADPAAEEITLPSVLLLLEDVGFYRARSRSLAALLGVAVAVEGEEAGRLVDLALAPDGRVASLVVERDGERREVEPAAASVDSAPVSTG